MGEFRGSREAVVMGESRKRRKAPCYVMGESRGSREATGGKIAIVCDYRKNAITDGAARRLIYETEEIK
jgi:hypothetical protein